MPVINILVLNIFVDVISAEKGKTDLKKSKKKIIRTVTFGS